MVQRPDSDLATAFLQAAHYTTAHREPGDVDTLWVHTTQGAEAERRSSATGAWFADPRSGGSAHYAVDPVQIVQCVREKDIAWGVGGAANKRGVHVEFCGRAEQTEEEWDDEASRYQVALAARLFAELCDRYDIPPIRLDVDGIRAGNKGIASHADGCKVYGGSHWDPGPDFPWDDFLALVAAELAGLGANTFEGSK